jgi:hypothetical protein
MTYDNDDILYLVRKRVSNALNVDDSVDINKSFGALGGTSIQAAIVLARLWHDLDLPLSLTDLTPDTKVIDLAKEIHRRQITGAHEGSSGT